MKKPLADKSGLFDRDPANFETDKAALEAIIQAAVNVELFTIPLYMTSMYSLQGVHQITGKKSKLYEGRLWPGLAPSFRPGSLGNIAENETAFNTIFSVFIEEMLHLQMASNLATSLGVTPEFTQMSPEAANYAWSVYGEDKTVIPYIVDFKDCVAPYDKIRVKLGSLTLEQNELFLAIEAPEAPEEAEPGKPAKVSAVERIKEKAEDRIHGYFPEVPFKGWAPGDPLPLFGTIGHMYQCLWDYLDIEYKEADGRIWTLFEKIYNPAALQQDLFNTAGSGHPYREYPDLETTVSGWLPDRAKEVIFKLICGITDQGEGKGITKNIRPRMGLMAVSPVNQSSDDALKGDYPSYTDQGEPAPSSHAHARYENDKTDHYDRFEEIKEDLLSGKILTWDNWRTDWPETKGGKWLASDLKGANYDNNTYNLPPAEEVAAALNRLGTPKNADGSIDTEKFAANYKQFCQIATGAIAGITTVLNNFWDATKQPVNFPFPSMGGSGDRLMMCWAVYGKFPDLSIGVEPREDGVLYHACQGMNLNPDVTDDDQCGSPQVYHNCKGSNSCKAEGGCGFVQEIGKSSGCGGSSKVQAAVKGGCGAPPKVAYSAPADNMCGSFGGCAVPISASQIYPDFTNTQGQANVGTMELNDFVGSGFAVETIPNDGVMFKSGDFVYDIAWEAFSKVLAHRNPDAPAPVRPEPSDIRLAFPPST